MKDSLQRINFIEREAVTVSYRLMVLAGVSLLLLMGAFYGVQILRMRWMDDKITSLRTQVTALKVEKEMRMKKQEAVSGEAIVNARRSLIKKLESCPSWALVLRDLTARIPNALWLTVFKSGGVSDVSNTGGRQVSMEGHADEASSITQFVQDLSAAPRFKDVILKNSQLEKDNKGVAYSFGIEMTVLPKSSVGVR